MEGSENQEPPKMLNAARRSHRKTRTGCRTCKRRKIKCDEGKPSCWNCIKHSVACDFAGGAAQSPSSSSQTPANASTPPTQQASFISDTGIWSSPSNAFSSLSLSGRHLPELNLHDLELLHHFSVSTCFSVTADPVLRNLWRAKIPQIGFSNKFVMRGILAISALHLAYLHPENKDFYYSHSMEHHELALKEATKVLPNVTSENCTALHIFSILTCIHTLGRPRKPEDFLVVGEHGIAKWLVLFRGVTDIIEPYDDVMASGPLAGLFQARVRRQKLRESCQVEDAHLRDLHDLILQTTRSETMIPIYTSTIADLQRAFTFIFNSAPHTHETGDVFVWLFRVSNEYLQALKEGTQEALAIFAYSCVLFKRMEGYWWMEGWSVQLMSNIYDFLDEEHRLWVRWPIKEIGWTPKY